MNATAWPHRPQLDLAFARRGDRTVLERRLFRWPFVVTRTFALDRVPAHLLTTILQTSSGAVHGEDRLAQRFAIGPGAAAHCTTQGASPIHRAPPGLTTRDAVDIRVAPGGYFEYWPKARILFPDAALDQTVDVDCARGAAALVGDAFTVHDPEAQGRAFRHLCATLTLRCEGETLAIDRLDIRGLGRGPTAGFKAFGTAVFMLPGRRESHARLAEVLSGALAGDPALYAAASLLPHEAGLGVRLASPELRHVTAGLELVRTHVRHQTYGASPTRRQGCDEPIRPG